MASILVVDDEEGVRTFLAEALESAGYRVSQAVDGNHASSLLERHSFHLVVTDLRMPGLDGLALLRKIKAETPETEVVVLTAHGSIDGAVEAMKVGALDFIEKPLGGPEDIRLLAARAVERYSLRALAVRVRDQEAAVPRLAYGAPAMEKVVAALRKVAPTNSTVLLLGESGTGKEVAARAVHAWGARSNGPFVAVNCAAVSEQLLEAELFGHEKGAFTGADKTRRGRLELAAGGTFFLDEIAELRPDLQVKLLRVLQERRFERVGGSRTIDADVRWMAATNRDLDERLAGGNLREDLYHRLAVFPVHLPPLRDRREDILPLTRSLLERISGEIGKPIATLSPEAERALVEAPWTGNIRELANALERAMILADGDTIEAEHLLVTPGSSPMVSRASAPIDEPRTLEEAEIATITQALERQDGHRERAAEELGIAVRTLYEKIKRYGLS